MAYMNMILIRTLKDSIKYVFYQEIAFYLLILFYFYYKKHQITISKFTIFHSFPSVHAADDETAANLVCRGQIG